MIHLGRCYRLLGDSDRAIYFYKKAIELDPNSGFAYTNMGVIYILREEYEEAKECYEKGLPLADKSKIDYWTAYANYAIVVAKLGDKRTAEKMIQKAEQRGYKNGENARKMAGINNKSFFSKFFS